MSGQSSLIVLGTRGSDLALVQARMAQRALREKCGAEVRIEVIRTSGDEPLRMSNIEHFSASLRFAGHDNGRKGIFTRELERALLEKRIDVAVHSAKDLPSEMSDGLGIAAVLPRGAAEDVLITKTPQALLRTIATSSVRRQRQVRWRKLAGNVLDLRGNVPTRLRKFSANDDWDGIILARAGLERLGFSAPEFQFEGQRFFGKVLPVEEFVPAGGQGVIALQTRAEDEELVSAVDHHDTHLCLRAEREFLRLLQGDCNLPVGAHARIVNGEIELRFELFGESEAPKAGYARGKEPDKVAAGIFRQLE